MDYAQLLSTIKELHFIGDDNKAEDAIKSVLGMLVSRLDENTAWYMTQSLPSHLSYEKLRGHQKSITTIDIDSFLNGIEKQFGFNSREAQILINTVVHEIKGFLSREQIKQIELALPSEWAALVEAV